MLLSKTRRRVAAAAAAALTASLLVAVTPARAQARPFTPTPVASVPGSDYVPPPRPGDPTGKMAVGSAPAVTWPTAAAADVDLTGHPAGSLLAVPGLPVRVGARPGPSVDGEPVSPLGRVTVQVYDRAAAARAGVDGVLLRLTDASAREGTATVQVDYSGFRQAYGGDWAGRLRLVALPQCALTTPDVAGCTRTELPSSNNRAAGVVSATVSLPAKASAGTLIALTAGDSSSFGDYKATTLAASGTWTGGGSSGDFNWSLPLRMPPGLGGPAPSVALSYSSQSTDGRTAASNSQPSWIGEGFEFAPGSIERSYQQCSDDGQPSTLGDQCWGGDNATLSLSGHAGELVQDSTNPTIWHPRNDDGSKVEKITTSNGDDNGEAWVLTTQDGARYYFGLNRLPGAPTGRDTNSTFTVPVFGDDAGEPCNTGTFATSYCAQAYRWNLDYVVDAVGNTMSLWYDPQTNKYARNHTDTAVSGYVRGGTVNHIEYGTRQDGSGNDSTFTASAPMRVDFGVVDRCITAGPTCVPSNTANWPDVPWDRDCTATNCAGRYGPTFWNTKRLSTVTTRVWGGSAYRDVERWTLNTEFRYPGDGNPQILWLRSVSHAGLTPGYPAASATPDVTFTAVAMTNRVDINDSTNPIWRFRLSSIANEAGGVVSVAYSPAECQTGTKMPASPESNTLRCFPTSWIRPGATQPSLEYFHRYVVTSVTEADTVAGGVPVTTYFRYLDAPAWHYDDNEFTPAARRTYGQWRGYSKVRTIVGQDGTTQSQSDTLFFRGMNGDRLPSGVRNVSIVDSTGTAVADEPWRTGGLREQINYNGVSAAGAAYGTGAPQVNRIVYDPWEHGPTATRTRNGVTVKAYVANAGRVTTYTTLDGGRAPRVTRVGNTFDGPTGRTLALNDEGDLSTAADDTCTRYEYAENAARWMRSYVARLEKVAVACAVTPDRATQLISDTRSWFDGATGFDKQVSKGKVTRIEEMSNWNGGSPTYVQLSRTSYDPYGRVLDAYDALDRRTTTAYTPASGGPVTMLTVTNPLGWQTKHTVEPAWALPTKGVDPNGRVTETQYDTLGRSLAIWLPDRNRATQTASLTFSYQVRNTAPSVVISSRLNTDGSGYWTSIKLYDGLMRERQTQAPSPQGTGRVIGETLYDYRGKPWKTNPVFYNSAAPSTTLFAAEDASIPSQAVNTYDSAGRAATTALRSYNVEQWRTTNSYGGDRVYTTPPMGGIATTSILDAQQRTTEVRLHKTGTPTGAYDATRYTYTPRGDLATVTDPAGNVWRFGYDLQGRKIRIEDPDTGVSRATYDAAGQPITSTDARGVKLVTEYDDVGRPTSRWQDAVGTGTKLTEFVYDTLAKGQSTSSTQWSGGNAYTASVTGYDTLYRPTGSQVTIPPAEGSLAGTYASSTSYNVDGSVATKDLPAVGGLPAETLRFSYTANGLVTGLSGLGSYLTGATYDALGRPVEWILSDGAKSVVENMAYETATGRLSRHLVWGDTTPQVIADYNYRYDAAGNVTAILDQLNQVGSGSDDNQCFRYDYLRRLTDAWTPSNGDCVAAPSTAGLSGPAPYWHSYGYDAVGNRTGETLHSGAGNTIRTYAYPAAGGTGPHRLSSVTTTGPGAGTTTYDYNEVGSTKTRGAQQLTWDPAGHLSTVTEGGNVTSFGYDAGGNRLLRRDPAGTTLYLPGQEIRRNAAGALSATRYYAGHAVRTTAAGLSWLASDHQGTSSVAVRASDLAVTTRRQTPFGVARGTGGAIPGERGFVGGTNDASTSLVHLGAREYDPTIGRFVSADPVVDYADPQQMQGYSYANNSPVTMSDPSGERPAESETGDTSAPAHADLHPDGFNPGGGPNKNVYQGVFTVGGKPSLVYVRITDACDKSQGPIGCNRAGPTTLDVEILGPAVDCGDHWQHSGTNVCYLGRDNMTHDLYGNSYCRTPRVCATGATAPNPVIRITVDLRKPAERTFVTGSCPDVGPKIPTWDKPKPPYHYWGYERPNERERDCSRDADRIECYIAKVAEWVSEYLWYVPVIGEVADLITVLDDVHERDYENLPVDLAGWLTGNLLPRGVGAAVRGGGRDIVRDAAARTEFGDQAGALTGTGAEGMCKSYSAEERREYFCIF